MMYNLNNLRPFVCLVSVISVLLATGCGTQPPHPNQFNPLDGASYDTLTLAHGALTSFRTQVSVSYPKYVPLFNQAATSYSVAYIAYALYRSTPTDSAALTVAISNLTVSIVALENSFQLDMQVSPSMVARTRKKAQGVRARVTRSLTVSDILTELEIAAALARTIPAASVYAGAASMVIAATSEALAAESASAGQPIDLSTISPIPSL